MRIKTLILLLLPFCAVATPITEHFRASVEIVESNGRNVQGANQDVGVMQMTARAWRDVSSYRRKNRLPVYPFSAAWNPKINRIYGKDYLALCSTRLAAEMKKAPSRQQIYAAYTLGFERFKKIGFGLDRLPGTTRKAVAKLTNILETEKKAHP